MLNKEFRNCAHQVADWIADYYDNIENYPVKSNNFPGEVKLKIGNHAPQNPKSFEEIFKDFQNVILPGITHWQHPGFMALFPSNTSFPSILAEFLVAGLGVNCMLWETSPAATELEESVLNWLKKSCGLPDKFNGVIHDTASLSTLTAIISAREKASQYKINENGFLGFDTLTMYCSQQAHYSVEKGAKAAGIGKENVRKIATDNSFAMIYHELENQIKSDFENGMQPFLVVATLGTTSSCAFDNLDKIGIICKQYNLWLHVDAAYAGSAFILPEYRQYLNGVEFADSYVFNPHKWLFTNFDCSAYYVKDAPHLINVFASNPDYLKRIHEEVINYKDWGIPLGRRFRALKLWFVLRCFGIDGLQNRLREHIRIAGNLHDLIRNNSNWEIMAPPQLNVLCVRYHPRNIDKEAHLDLINDQIIKEVNASGKFYLSATTLNGKYVIRIVPGQTNVQEEHVNELYGLLNELAGSKELRNK
jgi:aromatic-L-amino-acid decarboxylase